MNKIVGIDYGTKKVGIAVSDPNQKVAFPVDVFEDKDILSRIIDFCAEKQSKKIVIGESKNFDMSDNEIMKDIKILADSLEKQGFEVILENEFMSSMQASRLQGYNKKQDASAAALILQSYLDKQND